MRRGSAIEPASGASANEPSRCSVLSSVTVDTMAWAGRLGFLHTVQLFSRSECACIIAAAERADQWALRGEYEGTYTRDVDVSSLPELQWLDRHSDEVWEPLLASLFGARTRLKHLRIVKYSAENERARGIGLHSDGCQLSFICCLSDDIVGGGTYVRAISRIISPPCGAALTFCGRWIHEGVRVARGDRYVLTGFFELAGADDVAGPEETAAFDAVVLAIKAREEHVSLAPRLCPHRCHLRRCYAKDPCGPRAWGARAPSAPWQCSACHRSVPADGVLHACDAEDCAGVGRGSCGTRWCDTCLGAALGAAQAAEGWTAAAATSVASATAALLYLNADVVAKADGGDGEGGGGGGGRCDGGDHGGDSGDGGGGSGAAAAAAVAEGEEELEFVDDITLPDGALVEAGSCARKVWRLRMCSTQRMGSSQRMCSSQRGCDVGGALRLVRDDVDSDDRLISRCLGAEACSYPSDASLDASLDVAVDLMFPRSPCGPYRAFFRLVRSCVPVSVPAERDGPAAVDGFGGMIDGHHATQPPSWQPVHVHSWQPVGCRLWVDVVVVPPVLSVVQRRRVS